MKKSSFKFFLPKSDFSDEASFNEAQKKPSASLRMSLPSQKQKKIKVIMVGATEFVSGEKAFNGSRKSRKTFRRLTRKLHDSN